MTKMMKFQMAVRRLKRNLYRKTPAGKRAFEAEKKKIVADLAATFKNEPYPWVQDQPD